MNFHKIGKYFYIGLLSFIIAALSSCDDHFFENEGDCEVHHIVRFVYDMNLKWANAFPSEVNSVNLYVFDNNDRFVKSYIYNGEELSDPKFSIELDLQAGTYKMLAWCGLDNPGAAEESFSVPVPIAGVTTLSEMTCALNTQTKGVYANESGDKVYSTERLYFLYWGYLEATLVDNHDGQTYDYVICLTKDTNHVRIILQEINGEDLNPEDYEFTIESVNGIMSWNNQPIGDTKITYQPWSQVNDEVGVGKIDVVDGTLRYVKGVLADLSVARLMANQATSVFLTISNSETKDIIARVPLIQYALLSKSYYELAYGHKMTSQEFLDREDEYVLTFFLVNGRWMDAYIDIQQWRVVLHDYDV